MVCEDGVTSRDGVNKGENSVGAILVPSQSTTNSVSRMRKCVSDRKYHRSIHTVMEMATPGSVDCGYTRGMHLLRSATVRSRWIRVRFECWIGGVVCHGQHFSRVVRHTTCNPQQAANCRLART